MKRRDKIIRMSIITHVEVKCAYLNIRLRMRRHHCETEVLEYSDVHDYTVCNLLLHFHYFNIQIINSIRSVSQIDIFIPLIAQTSKYRNNIVVVQRDRLWFYEYWKYIGFKTMLHFCIIVRIIINRKTICKIAKKKINEKKNTANMSWVMINVIKW